MENEFFRQKDERDSRCKEKNSVICPILRRIKVDRPYAWKAILMPCLHGPELAILRSKKVPAKNIVAIENDRETWGEIRLRHGLDCGAAPLEANLAVEEISCRHEDGFNLIYLDFFSRPTFSHLQMLQKIFSFKMLKPGAKLILTFGKGRCRPGARELNEMLLKDGEILPTKTEVLAAAEISRHPAPRWIRNHHYRSAAGNSLTRYVTTEAQF